MSKISVIIPIYNTSKFLNDCLESVQKQTFVDFECIMIDDGSTDNSSEICKNYVKNDNRFHYFYKNNEGVSSSRNMGIDYVKSEFIVFIDSDDCVSCDYLSDLYEHRKYDYIISGFKHVYIDENNNEINCINQSLHEQEGKSINSIENKFFVHGYFHSCCGKMYRTKIIKDLNIKFKKIRLSEDSVFNLEYMSKIKSWKMLSQTNYCYYHRKSIYSATKKFEIDDINAYFLLHETLSELQLSTQTILQTMFPQYYGMIKRLVKSNDLKEEKKIILKSILGNAKIRKSLLFANVSIFDRYSLICFFIENKLFKYLFDWSLL